MKITWGDYPKDYKPEVHGPYNPGRYYGKPETPFGQVKLNELPAWFRRRSLAPRAIMGFCSRVVWRWLIKYKWAKHPTGVYFVQLAMMSSLLFYTMNHYKTAAHVHAKYH